MILLATVAGPLSALAEMSETQRGTFNGIEWLYTVDPEAKRVVLEKAILLTAEQYNMEINLDSIFRAAFPYDAGANQYDVSGATQYNVWIGASAFEGNEYLTGISFYKYDGVPVNLTICEKAFMDCVNLENIGYYYGDSVPIRVIDIGKSAFENAGAWTLSYGFFGLEEYGAGQVDFSPTNIGERAFYNCNGYTEHGCTLDISNVCEAIGDEAFLNCQLFKSISWPSSISRIGTYVFGRDSNAGAKELQFKFPEQGVEVIGDYAFTGLIFQHWTGYQRIGNEIDGYWNIGPWEDTDLVIPEGVVEVGDYAFNASGYRTLQLPTTLKRIGTSAFAGDTLYCGSWQKPWPPYLYRSVLSGTLTIPGNVESIGGAAFSDNPYLQRVVISEGQNGSGGLRSLEYMMFMRCFGLEEVVIPNTVTNIGSAAFLDCTNLTVKIPASVVRVGDGITARFGNPKHIIFEGNPPKGIIASKLLDAREVWVPIERSIKWTPYMRSNIKFATKENGEWVALGGKVVSSAMRASDPTIMDITYKVTSAKDRVNVRLLAFKNGGQSFGNVLKPETFVDGTGANIGDNVAANVEHTVSWKVASDWDIDLAKVSVAVYVKEDDLLPLLLTTIPATTNHVSVTFSRNAPSEDMVKNALFWLYADGASDLTLANGVLSSDGTQLASGTTLSAVNAVSYLYSKMGYGTLSGDTLSYVKSITRQNLSPSGINQYAVKEGGE